MKPMKTGIARVQVCLEDGHYAQLKVFSNRSGKSMSRIIRECLSKTFEYPEQVHDPILDIIGIGKGGGGHVGRDHDRYLYDVRGKKAAVAKSRLLRVQICLDPSQHQRLKMMSKRTGKSISSLLRDCLTEVFAKDPSHSKPPRFKFIGTGEGSGDAVAEHHDEYLYGK